MGCMRKLAERGFSQAICWTSLAVSELSGSSDAVWNNSSSMMDCDLGPEGNKPFPPLCCFWFTCFTMETEI